MEELLDRLKVHPALQGVPDAQLQWLINNGEIQHYPAGNVFAVGHAIEYMMIMLEGSMRAYKVQNGQQVEIAAWGADVVTGSLPFSRMKTSPVSTEVVAPVTVLGIHKSKHRDMLCECPELTETLVHILSDRVRTFTTYHFQNEKLMALGKLSAGLAHELNNPAAAIVRSASSLRSHLASLLQGAEELTNTGLPDGVIMEISEIVNKCLDRRITNLSPLDRSEREDDLSDWLRSAGIENPDDVATDFVDVGFTAEDLKPVAAAVPKEASAAAVNWMRLALNSSRHVMHIEEAAKRISALVGSVKNYTRLDQVQDKQPVDVNEGIRNTLMILQHKSRHNNVTVNDELKDGLPKVIGYPGELNQVWTNIMDNALDAMEKGGTLTLRSSADSKMVTVEILDSGPGIPDEIQERIFDPFFTTKEIGRGSGVGLDVVQQIIRHHAGKIEVNSKPGSTVFSVCLPRAE